MTCRPTVLFPNAPKGKYPVCAKEGPTDDASTSKDLRRSLRGRQGLLLGIEIMKTNFSNRARELRKVLIMPRKLDFRLLKKTKAVVGKG